MNIDNKIVLENANAAVSKGDYEKFLSFCTDDTEWIFIGDQILSGKDAVRNYMATTYLEPPIVIVDQMIAEGDSVIAIGAISIKNEIGEAVNYNYCDVWRFREGKLADLKAFVIESPQ